MAKKIVKSTVSRDEIKNAPAAYFKSLTLENVKCFKGEHTIDLSDGNGKPANWTVILGNNNTGKTTILHCISGLEAKELDEQEQQQHGFLSIVQGMKSGWFALNQGFNVSSEIVFLKKGYYLSNSESDLFTTYGDRTVPLLQGMWEYSFTTYSLGNIDSESLQIIAYGTNRGISKSQITISEYSSSRQSSLISNTELDNIEEWILQLVLSGNPKALEILNRVKLILTGGLLPDVKGFKITHKSKGATFENYVLFMTDFGDVRLRDLGYGYQSMMAWVLDLVRRMVERYPDSKSPLEEAAIVLVDEIDLHLHPEWQRKIIAHLTKYFPNTQFIVTAHSPLIVQSSDNINVVILRKEGDHTIIEQPKIRNFRGWTVEEILSDLMDLDGKTMSETYLNWINEFTEGIENDDFEKTKNAYKELDKILHPRSELRKLFRLEMTSLTPSVNAL